MFFWRLADKLLLVPETEMSGREDKRGNILFHAGSIRLWCYDELSSSLELLYDRVDQCMEQLKIITFDNTEYLFMATGAWRVAKLHVSLQKAPRKSSDL